MASALLVMGGVVLGLLFGAALVFYLLSKLVVRPTGRGW